MEADETNYRCYEMWELLQIETTFFKKKKSLKLLWTNNNNKKLFGSKWQKDVLLFQLIWIIKM